MTLRIMSHRGDHVAEIQDLAVARALFDKLTGARREALDPAALPPHIPDTFQELEELWREGRGTCAAFELERLRRLDGFDPEARTIMFVPPVMGG